MVAEFGRMLEAEIPRLRRYARALCRDAAAADDLVQDCLCRALRKSHLFQPGSDLRAWLFTILHNLHVNGVRSSVRQGASVPFEDVEPLLTEPPAQGAGLTLRDLDRAMGAISEEQRQVVLLVGLEAMSYEQVATILGVPMGTVRSRLSRGREWLRELIGHDQPKLPGRGYDMQPWRALKIHCEGDVCNAGSTLPEMRSGSQCASGGGWRGGQRRRFIPRSLQVAPPLKADR